MDEAQALINQSRRTVERELETMRRDKPGGLEGGMLAAVNRVCEEDDPREIAKLLATGQWCVINCYTRGRNDLKVIWSLGHIGQG